MRVCQAPLFRKRQFAADIIVTCVRWYLRFSLSLRDVEELMAERGLSVDHTTVWRWTQRYAPEVQHRLRGQLKPKGSTWHMDETFVRIAGRWMYLFRAVDSGGQTVDFYLSETRDREAAKCFLKRALDNPDNRTPHVFARDRLRSYPAAIRELQHEGQLHHSCRHRTRRYSNNRIESDHRHIKRRLRSMHGPRSLATACAVLAGIEAVQMIRKGQVLGITKKNLHGQAWVSAICSVSTSLNSSPPSLTDRPFNTVATLPAQVFLQSLDTVPYKDFGRASTAFGPVDESVRGRRPTPPPASRGVREDDGIASGERWDKERHIKRRSKYATFTPDRKARFLAALSYHLTVRVRTKVFSEKLLLDIYDRIHNQFGLPANEGRTVAMELESHNGIIVQGSRTEYEFSHFVRDSFPEKLADYLTH